jgi:hypothetical protein
MLYVLWGSIFCQPANISKTKGRMATTYRETVLTSEAAVVGALLGFFDDVNTFQAVGIVLVIFTENG